MQISGFALSPTSTPIPKPSHTKITPRVCPNSVSSCFKPADLGFVNRVSCLQTSHFASFFSSRISSSFTRSNQRFDNLKVRAASVPDNVEETPKSSAVIRTVQLGGMFGLWYLLNIYFNIFNKQVLKVYPYPTTVTAFQFGCGTVMIILMWTFNLYHRPKLTRSQFAAILPLAVAHTMGNLLTNVSLGTVNVSFTHTIKAMEPFFTVLLAALFLGERTSFWVVSSIVPIVGGVVLASSTEASFNWISSL